MRDQLYDDKGYYCGSVGCVDDEYFGNGELSPLLDFGQSSAVCGVAAFATGGGGGAGCVILGYVDSIMNCLETDPITCAIDIFVDELGGKYLFCNNATFTRRPFTKFRQTSIRLV